MAVVNTGPVYSFTLYARESAKGQNQASDKPKSTLSYGRKSQGDDLSRSCFIHPCE